MTFRILTWSAIAAISVAVLRADLREFTSSDGKTLQAELVEHRDGKVTLRRADGKEFEVAPNVFSPEDQIFIKEWISKTPESLHYNFRFDADRTKISGTTRNESFLFVKNEKWVYTVKITNNSRDTMNDLVVKYKQFRSNYADDDSQAYDDDRSDWLTDNGEVKLSQELPYNKTMEFQTKPMQIDFVDYEGFGDKWKDEIKGVMIRIETPAGKKIAEWAEPVNTLKGKTWENTEPRKGGGSEVIIK